MGDRYRFRVFARFIREVFPQALAVADVAGGRGLLSVELMALGLQPVVIDPRHVDRMPRQVRKAFQRQAMRSGHLPQVVRAETTVECADLAAFDLIVGLHPDEATEPLVRRAIELGKPFAVVPCCVMPVDGIARSHQEWMEYLAALAPGTQRRVLPMAGANIVLFRVIRSASGTGNPLAQTA